MIRNLLLALGLLLALSSGELRAQQDSTGNQGGVIQQDQGATTQGRAPFQSIRPAQSPCGAGSQSVRVCNDDFRSCGSTCTATALDPSADTAGCSLRCCTQFKACLQIRGCASPTLQCF
jgi:hypothetical protein